MNEYDELGRKHGYWVESSLSDAFTNCGLYINGKKEGIWKIYSKNILESKLLAFFTYKDDEKNGYYYHINGGFGNFKNGYKIGFWQELRFQQGGEDLSKLVRGIYRKEYYLGNTPVNYKKVTVIFDELERPIHISSPEKVYAKAKYNQNGEISFYADYLGNWYDETIFKHNFQHKMADLYCWKNTLIPESDEYCRAFFSNINYETKET